MKDDAHTEIADVVRQFGLQSSQAQVFIVDPNDKVLVKRRDNGTFDQTVEQSVAKTDLDEKYKDVIRNQTNIIATKEIEAPAAESMFQKWFTDVAEVAGYASVQVGNVEPGRTGHGYMTLVAVPRKDAYATIYNNKVQISAILSGALVATLVLGWYFGRKFIGPLLEIIDVTRQLHAGRLYNRTDVKRSDELGDLASQVNSVAEKFTEVISQVRDSTASVSTASNELNSSAHQLAQGSAEQAATLQEIAGSLQSVDSSVGRNAQHARDTARMANEASSQAEKGGEAVRETVVAMRVITEKILIVDDIAYQTNLLALKRPSKQHAPGRTARDLPSSPVKSASSPSAVNKLRSRSSDLAKKSVAIAENAGSLLDRTVPMIRDTSNLIQEIAVASQEQMTAIREINVGVSQLEEVVQQNAAASHELSATATGLASQSSTLQHQVDFFQVDTTGNGYAAGPEARDARTWERRRERKQLRPSRSLLRSAAHRVPSEPTDTTAPHPVPAARPVLRVQPRCRRIPPRPVLPLHRRTISAVPREGASWSTLTTTTTSSDSRNGDIVF